jgi:glycosyltransferase involved in cell wall biosynthesis
VKFLPDFDRNARAAFLQSLTVLSVPALKETSSGTYLLEAMAAGVPVVQPSTGGLSEIVERTGGGILYAPNTPEKLTEALKILLLDLRKTREMGQRARAGVSANFRVEKMAAELVEIYKGVTRKA